MNHRAILLALAAALLVAGCGAPERPPGHASLPAIALERDPNPDPAVVAWAGCLETVAACLEGGGQVRRCATVKACGSRCVNALNIALAGKSGREAELAAFESVFVNRGAVCRPPERPRK